MATAETVELGPPHPPKEESIKVFKDISSELKKLLVHSRHSYDKHEGEYFAAAAGISDAELSGFDATDLDLVRVATSAYGIHLFGRVRIPALASGSSAAPGRDQCYVHFRVHVPGGDEPPKLHSIHTEERLLPDGDRKYRAFFTKDDALEWFDT